MPTNKNALIRYKTIDKCLQNRYRRWTLEDFIEACSDALYEFEGKQTNVSKRTIQLDLQIMRSNKLGYNAPIVCYDKKYYKYDEEDYSLNKVPIGESDLMIIKESLMVLSQFKDFSLFKDLGGTMTKLQDIANRELSNRESIVHLETNDQLTGLEHIDDLYQSILKELVLDIHYKPFGKKRSKAYKIHPCILKEFNNRWFLVGFQDNVEKPLILPLDRIISYQPDLKTPYDNRNFNPDEYFAHTIGVSVQSNDKLLEVEFLADAHNAPYIETKPFHGSQKIIQKFMDGSIRFSIKVHHNYEFERLILGFGSGVEILSPLSLRKRIKSKIQDALRNYETKEN